MRILRDWRENPYQRCARRSSTATASSRSSKRRPCAIESAPAVPSSEPSAEDGVDRLKLAERVAECQVSAEYPHGFAIPGSSGRDAYSSRSRR